MYVSVGNTFRKQPICSRPYLSNTKIHGKKIFFLTKYMDHNNKVEVKTECKMYKIKNIMKQEVYVLSHSESDQCNATFSF